jgi:cobalamin-dependent methionine synthase I
VQEATDVRLILDSADVEVLAEGLRACRQTRVLNALTLEPGKLARLPELAAEAGADLVALLLDGASRVAATADEKIALAVALWQQAVAAGLPEEHLLTLEQQEGDQQRRDGEQGSGRSDGEADLVHRLHVAQDLETFSSSICIRLASVYPAKIMPHP